MTKIKSKHWSMKDMRSIKQFIKTAIDAGGTEKDGINNAAAYFGVTANAVGLRFDKFLKGTQIGRLKGKSTTKTPMVRKKRKYTKKKFSPAMLEALQGKASAEVQSVLAKRKYTKRELIAKYPVTHNVYPVAREITFDIRDVKVDLVNKKITFVY